MPKDLNEIFTLLGLAVVGNPWVALIIGIIAIVALIIPIIILWAYGLLTAFVFFALSIVALFVMAKAGIVNVEKMPWLFIIPFLMFFLGLYSERSGAFFITPLQEKPFETAPLFISPREFITANIETLLLFTFFILLTIAFVIKRK